MVNGINFYSTAVARQKLVTAIRTAEDVFLSYRGRFIFQYAITILHLKN